MIRRSCLSVSRSSRKSRSVLNVHRPRVRSHDGHEAALPTWAAAQAEDWPGRGAMNLILINVSTRKLRCAVRLPEGVIATKMGRPIEGGQNILARLKALIATSLPRTALRAIDDKPCGVNCNVGWSGTELIIAIPERTEQWQSDYCRSAGDDDGWEMESRSFLDDPAHWRTERCGALTSLELITAIRIGFARKEGDVLPREHC